MARLHVFNPEHDMALASNDANFVAPHAAREMRADLGFLPAFWAEEGDYVLVDDISSAINSLRHWKRYVRDVLFVTLSDLPHLPQDIKVLPWGWDKALCRQLLRRGLSPQVLPTIDVLDTIRNMSHRNWASEHLLRKMVLAEHELTGRSELIVNVEQLEDANYTYVIKAPWSSSGKGLRYVDGLTPHQRGWAKNMIIRQGGLMLEPYYNKLKDFAVEFYAHPDRIEYLGLSLFQSSNGAYAGNILATEEEKQAIIGRFIPFHRIQHTIDMICHLLHDEMVGKYVGPFGIDMMIVDENGKKLHPCVEMNLRRTMGHVALSFSQQATDARKLMQISYSGGYHFRIITTAENCLSSVW